MTMEAPSVQQLEAMKYSELQNLAKGAGLKANLRADKLLRALKQHFHPESKTVCVSEDSEGNSTLTDTDEFNSSQEKEDKVPVCHITHRRGRGKVAIHKEASPILVFGADIAESSIEIQVLELEQQQNSVREGDEVVEESSSASEKRQRKRQRTEQETSEPDTAEPKDKTTAQSLSVSQNNEGTGAPPCGKIPRYVGRSSKPASKPTTPNFKKMHEAHFKKMESIDKYMARKQKRLDDVSNSIQEVKMLAKKSNLHKLMENTPSSNLKKPMKCRVSLQSPAPRKSLQSPAPRKSLQSPAPRKSLQSPAPRKSLQSPAPRKSLQSPAPRKSLQSPAPRKSLQSPAPRKSLQSPAPRKSLKSPAPRKSLKNTAHNRASQAPVCTPASKRCSTRISMANKSILVDKSGFKPSVFSSSKQNVRFSEATEDNEHKRSLIKTPARKSTIVASVTPSSELRRSLPAIQKSDVKPLELPAETNLPVTTPFKFTAQNTETPSTNNKSKFNLQASLARPLGYQPHKGKLKPWADGKENQSGLRTNVSILKSNFKQPQLHDREDRRNQQEKERKSKRNQTVGTRRGVAVQ